MSANRLGRLLDGNPLLLGVAAIGFSVSFQTVAGLAVARHLPGWAPLYPVGMDLGIAALIVESRHLIRMGKSDLVPRLLAWLLTGATVYANVHGSPPGDWVGRGLHAVMPCLWVACLELTRRRMIASEVRRREGVPLARWLLAPWSTFAIYRRMVLWQVTSYSLALQREQVRRQAIARLRARHGKDWRELADSSVVWQLRHGIDVEGAAAATLAATPVPPVAVRHAARAKPRQRARQKRSSPRDKWSAYETANPGASASDVAAVIGVSKRTVERWRGQATIAEAERALTAQ